MLSRAAHGTIDGLLKGDELLINPYVLQRLPELWTNPQTFDPTRWHGGESDAAPAFLPFGHGPRQCPGRTFALLEFKIMIMSMLQRVKLSPVGRLPPREELFISLRPAAFSVVATPR